MRILLRLMTFARKYWWLLVLAFVCMMASTAFVLIIPQLISRVVDTVLGEGRHGDLIWLGIAVVAAGALRGLSAFGNSYLSEVVSQKTAYDIRNALYDKLQRLSFSFHDQAQTGELMSRGTADVEAIRMFFGRGLLGLLQIVILFVAISFLLVRLNWFLALLTVGFLAAVGWRAVVVANYLAQDPGVDGPTGHDPGGEPHRGQDGEILRTGAGGKPQVLDPSRSALRATHDRYSQEGLQYIAYGVSGNHTCSSHLVVR